MSDGSPALMRSRRARTRSTTSTVLVPDCFLIDSEMALTPGASFPITFSHSRVWLRTSSFESLTRATSPTVTTDPVLYERTIRSKSRTSRSRPMVRIAISDGPEMKLPPGDSMFCLDTALATWAVVSP